MRKKTKPVTVTRWTIVQLIKRITQYIKICSKIYRHRNNCHEESLYSQVPRTRRHSISCHAGPWRKGPGLVRRPPLQGEQRAMRGPEPFSRVFWGEMGKTQQVHLGLDSVNNFGRLQAIVMVPICLVPGPGLIQGRGNNGLVCEFDDENGQGYGLQIGWFVYKRLTLRRDTCYL